jgi:hypothetical protein
VSSSIWRLFINLTPFPLSILGEGGRELKEGFALLDTHTAVKEG